jgi:hypothetical protein
MASTYDSGGADLGLSHVGDQVAEMANAAESASQDGVFRLAPAFLVDAHGENLVRDVVEVGAHLLQRVSLAVDDRFDQADEDMGAGVVVG